MLMRFGGPKLLMAHLPKNLAALATTQTLPGELVCGQHCCSWQNAHLTSNRHHIWKQIQQNRQSRALNRYSGISTINPLMPRKNGCQSLLTKFSNSFSWIILMCSIGPIHNDPGPDNGLAPKRRKTLIWTNNCYVHRCEYAPLTRN